MEEEKKVSKKTTAKSSSKKSATAPKSTSKSTTKKAGATTEKKKTTAKSVAAKKGSSTVTKKETTGVKKGESVKKKTASTTKKTGTTSKKKTTTKEPKKVTTKRKTTVSVEKKNDVLKEMELPKKVDEIKKEKFVISEDIPKEVEISSRKEEKKEEPSKKMAEMNISNIIIAAIVIVWIFILFFLGNRMYHKYQQKLYNEGYFYHENSNIKKASISDLQNIIESSNSKNLFFFFNYRQEKETYELEKELSTIITDYHLQDDFYYIDLTDMSGQLNCELSCVANEALGIETINNMPAIVYVRNGAIIDIAQREDKKILEAADFVKLLDIYEFKK